MVKAENGCTPAPGLSADQGCTWNWISGVSTCAPVRRNPVARLAAIAIGPERNIAYFTAIRAWLNRLRTSSFSVGSLHLNTSRACRWSCMFLPTARTSRRTSIPCSRSCSASPIPDTINNCGDPIAPDDRITSAPARTTCSCPAPSR